MNLSSKVTQMPRQCGVYLMKNRKKKIIYVGKAKNLRTRLKSYFSKDIANLKITALIKEICDVEVILTDNEIEALLLERTLIKHQKPKYNILLRDDKEYPWLRIDLQEQWPRIEKVRQKKEDGAVYFGPYGNVGYLNLLLGLVTKIFPLIRCSRYQFKHAKRPCNYYQMKMCLAPCYYDIPRADYIRMLKRAMAVFQGKTKEVVADLTAAMQEASAQENYEQAAKLRDQLTALQTSTQKQAVVLKTRINADVFGIAIQARKALIYILLIRDGFVQGSDHFTVTSLLEDEKQVLMEFILQYYEHRPLPAKLLVPFALEQVLLAALPTRNRADDETESRPQSCKAVVPVAGEEQHLIALAQKNAGFQLKHLTRDLDAELQAVQKLLELAQSPHRIECLDISNLQNTAIVASIVCFIAGKPQKSLYRRYKLAEKSEKPDDYAAIATVVRRRLQRAKKDNDCFDLLLIDGGKGQLQAAVTVFRALDMPLHVASLAKDRRKHSISHTLATGERIFLPQRRTAIPLHPDNNAFRLLTHLRDESHRFALAYHRKLRGKSFL